MRQGCEERPSPRSQAHLLQLRAGPHLAAPETAPPVMPSQQEPYQPGEEGRWSRSLEGGLSAGLTSEALVTHGDARGPPAFARS